MTGNAFSQYSATLPSGRLVAVWATFAIGAQDQAERAAVAEAAGLRVEWINGTWYVLHADGAAWSNIGHADEASAQAEAAEALRAAVDRLGA